MLPLIQSLPICVPTAPTILTRLLLARLHLQLLAILPLVLSQALTGVVPWYLCLATGASIPTWPVFALILVQITEPPSPAPVTGAGVVPHLVHIPAPLPLH